MRDSLFDGRICIFNTDVVQKLCFLDFKRDLLVAICPVAALQLQCFLLENQRQSHWKAPWNCSEKQAALRRLSQSEVLLSQQYGGGCSYLPLAV